MSAVARTLKLYIAGLGIEENVNVTVQQFGIIAWLPFMYLTTMPASGLAMECATWMCIKFMNEAFHKFKHDFLGQGLTDVMDQFKNMDDTTKREVAKQRFQKYLAYGIDLDKLVETLCTYMATTIAMQYTICLINGTLAGYQCLGLLLRIKRIDILSILMFGAFTFMSGFYFVRLYYTTKDSQEMNSAMKSTAEEIEDLVIDCPWTNEIFDDQMEVKVKHVIKSIKGHTFMSPMSLFPINNAAFLTIMSTIMTYIIVLMQLKTTELPLIA